MSIASDLRPALYRYTVLQVVIGVICLAMNIHHSVGAVRTDLLH